MNLPESVLLCLFPNGLALSRQSRIDEDEEDEEVYGVDVSIKISFFLLLLFPLVVSIGISLGISEMWLSFFFFLTPPVAKLATIIFLCVSTCIWLLVPGNSLILID